jgi:hypothetical protein
LPNSSGKSKDRYAPTIASASGPVISRRRFVTLFGAAASVVLIGPHRPASAAIYFQDGFDRDADTFPNWDKVLTANNSATTDATIKRQGTHSLKLSVEDIDSNTFGYTGVRAHLTKNNLFAQGTERYIGFSLYIPSDHPDPTKWHNLFQVGYTGNTLPPSIFGLVRGGRLSLESLSGGSLSQWSLKWASASSVKGAWHDIVMRVYFHRDPAQGWVELWLDGVAQTMANGQHRIYYSTIHPNESATASGHLHVNNYRARGQYQWSTIYHDAVRVGSTYGIVDPAR